MVKTTINPALEMARKAQEATQKANMTNDPADIDYAVSEWEAVTRLDSDGGNAEDQAYLLSSYASVLLKRWHVFHHDLDLKDSIANLKNALNKLSYKHAETRYDLLIRLAEAHQLSYELHLHNKNTLSQAIHYWEDAYGLSVFLRRTKDSVTYLGMRHFIVH